MAKKQAKKPAGWKAFDALARDIVQVPKSEIAEEKQSEKPTKRTPKK